MLLPAILSWTCVLVPQASPGHVYVSTFADRIQNRGTLGGIFVMHPRIAERPAAVTGLGADLTGVGVTNLPHGANSVSVTRDGRLIVGELGQAGAAIDLHEITLTGTRVVTDRRVRLGVIRSPTQFGGGVQQTRILRDGRVLVGVRDVVAPGPLGGALLGIVDTRRRHVVAVPVTPVPAGLHLATTCDAAERFAYFAMVELAPLATSIYRVAIPGGGAPVRVARVTGRTMSGLAFDRSGLLLCSAGDTVLGVDPRTGSSLVLGRLPGHSNGIARERATGRVFYVLNGLNAAGPGTYHLHRQVSTLLTRTVTGTPSGVAVHDDPIAYGIATDGAGRYRWRTDPAPGGLPRLGNGAFALRLDATGSGASVGLLLAGTRRADVPVLGLRLLVGTAFPLGIVAVDSRLPLPIPNDGRLPGVRLTLQTILADRGAPRGLAASDGLEITVLR